MARTTAENYTQAAENFGKATEGTDKFNRIDLIKLAEAVDKHDHSDTRGRGIKRIQTASTPAANGEVQVANNKLAYHDGSAVRYAGMVRIAETILGADAATVTFSSIPQTFRHLKLLYIARQNDDTANNLSMRFNGDTGANYDTVVAWGRDLTEADTYEWRGNTRAEVGWITGGTDAAGLAGVGEFTIFDYARTVWKKSLIYHGYHGSGVANKIDWLRAGATWNSTATVTSVTLLNSNGTSLFVTGSVFTLYGIPD